MTTKAPTWLIQFDAACSSMFQPGVRSTVPACHAVSSIVAFVVLPPGAQPDVIVAPVKEAAFVVLH